MPTPELVSGWRAARKSSSCTAVPPVSTPATAAALGSGSPCLLLPTATRHPSAQPKEPTDDTGWSPNRGPAYRRRSRRRPHHSGSLRTLQDSQHVAGGKRWTGRSRLSVPTWIAQGRDPAGPDPARLDPAAIRRPPTA